MMALGIRTLEDLRGRCVIEDDTGCWLFQPNRRSAKGWGINVWLPSLQRTETLQRAAWLLSGKPMGQGRDWTVWRTCRNPDCGNPAHLKAGPRRAYGAWVEATDQLKGDPARSAINKRNKLASGTARITQELADWVRESGQSGIVIAHALDVSPHCISRVRTGKTWTHTVRGASVFSWANHK
jgi:hypothetical protein